jgi:hypothetical protein
MNVRALLTLILALPVVTLAAGDSPTERREIRDRNGNGNPERVVDSVYDGTNLVRQAITADTNDDGLPDQKIITCYRNGKKACVFWRHMDQSNRTTRMFLAEGHQVLMDDDEHGDGHFETLLLFGTNDVPAAMFRISGDGVPAPVPEAEFKEHVEGFEFGNEVVAPVLKALAETGKTKDSEPQGGGYSPPAARSAQPTP